MWLFRLRISLQNRNVIQVMKSLRKRLEKSGRNKLCPADVKAVMGEFGWLPKERTIQI